MTNDTRKGGGTFAKFEKRWNSEASKDLLVQIQKASRMSIPVLILGESGTGKTLVARCIHELRAAKLGQSPEGPYEVVNMAGLPPDQAYREIFGSEGRVFTGAPETVHGAIDRAAGGTLFLDEVGDADPFLQGMLLRFLDTGKYRRLGGQVEIESSTEVIGATNKDLPQMVADGAFREDLYFRLRGLEFTVPPLRDRLSDLEAFVEELLKSLGGTPSNPTGVGQWQIEKSAVGLLREEEQQWPGNLRQLQRVLILGAVNAAERIEKKAQKRSYALTDAETPQVFSEADLQPTSAWRFQVRGPTMQEYDTVINGWLKTVDFMTLRKRYTDAVLASTKRNVTAAASVVGKDRGTLGRWLAEHEEWEEKKLAKLKGEAERQNGGE